MGQALRKEKNNLNYKLTQVGSKDAGLNNSARASLTESSLKSFPFQLLAGKVYNALLHEKTLVWQSEELRELELKGAELAIVLRIPSSNQKVDNSGFISKQLESLSIQSANCFSVAIFLEEKEEKAIKEKLSELNLSAKIYSFREGTLNDYNFYELTSKVIKEKHLLFLDSFSLLHPQAVFILLKELIKDPNLLVCYFNEIFFKNNKPFSYLRKVSSGCSLAFEENNWLGGSYLIDSKILDKTLNSPDFFERDNQNLKSYSINHLIGKKVFDKNVDFKKKIFIPLALSNCFSEQDEVLSHKKNIFLTNSQQESFLEKGTIQIVVPFKDQPELTIRCLQSIFKQQFSEKLKINLINNNSTKTSLNKISSFIDSSKTAHDVGIVNYSGHFNFARINNYGAGLTNSDYILFLNNDVQLLSSDALNQMKSFAKLEEVGIVGASLYYPDESLQHSGINFAAIRPLNVQTESMFAGHLREVDGVSFAMALLRRDVWQMLGGLDELNCPNGFGDALFCKKLLDNNYKSVLLPNVKAFHYESISRGQSLEDLELYEMTNSGLQIASEFHSLEAKRQPEFIKLSADGANGEYFEKLVWQIRQRKFILGLLDTFAKFLVFLKDRLKSFLK